MQSTGRINGALRILLSHSYDQCRSCGGPLPRDIAAYAGYARHGSPRYVGNCCLAEIEELATHVYWWWEADKRVAPETKLWRYIDLAKFIALLETRSLFFARADKLGDPFEGASGISDRQQEWDGYYLDYFRNLVRHPPVGSAPPEAEVEANATLLLEQMKASVAADRTRTFVSCWHANLGESEALWRLYCPPGTSGVAIETTAARLLNSLGQEDIDLGRVQYVDFRSSFAGVHDRIFWKRSSLSHEAEVRAVFRNRFSKECAGVTRTVDIDALCVSIVPSPFAPPWFREIVERLLRKYEVRVPVTESDLLAQPFY